MKKITSLMVAMVAAWSLTCDARPLVWDDPNPPGVVEHFNVYDRADISAGSWQFIAAVSNRSYQPAWNAPQMFFTITAVAVDGTEVPLIQTSGATRSTFAKLLTPRLRA